MKLIKKNISKVESELITLIQEDVTECSPTVTAVYLEGGHFDPRYSATDFSTDSLTKALNVANNAILAHKKDIKIVLGVLIDDLGLQCGVESCEISPSPTQKSDNTGLAPLPDELETILDQYKFVKRDKLVIQGERNCKNRGIQSLRKIVSNQLTQFPQLSLKQVNEVTQVIFRNQQGTDIVLAESKDKDIWIAKCPLIMAQHYKDAYQKALKIHPQVGACHIMDFSEMDDYNKVVNGTEVAMALFLRPSILGDNKLKISNVFLSDFDAEHYSINTVASQPVKDCAA